VKEGGKEKKGRGEREWLKGSFILHNARSVSPICEAPEGRRKKGKKKKRGAKVKKKEGEKKGVTFISAPFPHFRTEKEREKGKKKKKEGKGHDVAHRAGRP